MQCHCRRVRRRSMWPPTLLLLSRGSLRCVPSCPLSRNLSDKFIWDPVLQTRIERATHFLPRGYDLDDERDEAFGRRGRTINERSTFFVSYSFLSSNASISSLPLYPAFCELSGYTSPLIAKNCMVTRFSPSWPIQLRARGLKIRGRVTHRWVLRLSHARGL